MKNTAIHIFIYIFLVFVAGKSLSLYFDADRRANRMEENFKNSWKENEYFKGKNGELAAKVTATELTVKELRNTIPEVVNDLKSLYIRPGTLKSFTQTSSKMTKEVVTPLKDSIPGNVPENSIKPATLNTIKTIHFSDRWFNVNGTIRMDTAKFTISTIDTIKTAIYQSRVHRLLWIFSRKTYKTVVTNVNPNIKVIIDKCIIIKQ